MKKLYCLYFLALLVVVAGCGSSDVSANVEQTPSAPGTTPKVGDTVNGTKIVNKPPSEVPAGGIMLQPDNPNDPHFKPDPNLRGGG